MHVKNESFFDLIGKRNKLYKIVIAVYMVFNGCFAFPIRLTYDYSSIFLFFIPNILVGLIFAGLYREKYLRVFISAFIFNSIGLLCRILLEWGEYSMSVALKTFNVIAFIMIIPLLVTAAYFMIQKARIQVPPGQ